METLLKDLRYGVRMLAKKPVFTLVVVAALALGIGANTAIFSVVNSLLLRPLPYRDPDRLVMVWMDNTRLKVDQDIHSYANYADYRDQNQSFEQLATFVGISVNLTGDGEPERVIGLAASRSLFEVAGVDPIIGRTFSPDEEVPGQDRVVVLGYGLWQRRFGGDASVLGQEISLSDVKRTVIGVMPPGFMFPHRDADEFWVPLAPDANRRNSRYGFGYYVVGRLKRDITLEQAKADMGAIAAHLAEQFPQLEGYGVNLVPLHLQIVGRVRPALLVLLGTVAFVLLIACANVANLLLARGAAREREIAIRAALGAGRSRLIRQLLTESVLIAVLGGAAGLLIANWGLKVLVALSPDDIPRRDQIGIDLRVLGFTLLISLVTGLVFGLVPSLQASRLDLNGSLKEGGRGASGGGQSRLRSALVVFEVALSFVLLVGAGLMIRSFIRLHKVDLGFNPDHLVAMNFQLSRLKYQGRQSAQFFRQLVERVESLPGVEAAGGITAVFIEGLPNSSNFTIEGRPPLPAAEQTEAPTDFVTPSYFRTMGIPLLRGRELSEQDGPDSQRVVIINNTFARRFWPTEDPVGKRFKFGDPDSTAPWLTIVGIVGDMRRTGFDSPVRCEAFLPYTQRQFNLFIELVVRTASDPRAIVGPVREIVTSIDPNQPISHVRTMDQVLGGMIAQRRLNTILFALFAGVALVLAAVGVYGVISYSVTQRTHEIGIRMALGAGRGEVLKLVVGNGMTLVGIGIGIGLISAAALTRLMVTLLYGVSPTDPVTFALISAVLAGVALVACLVPARRATKVDPMIALRYEG